MLQIQKILILMRPVNLIFALLTYGLGLGIARYLGATLYPEPQIFGGVIIILIMAASALLTEYFRPFNEPIFPDDTRKERAEIRPRLLTISIACMGTAALLAILLRSAGFVHAESAIFLVLFTLLALMNAVPPFRLVNRGLGELSIAIQVASFSPTLAFLFEYNQVHRILTIYTLPLLLLALAYYLSYNFPAYSDDLKYERRSLLVSLTWQRAVPIHNILLIGAYLFFACLPFLGLPLPLVWPALLSLPVAAYQVFTLRNLSDGAKPNWPLFVATATTIFGLTAYSLTLTFWLR